MASHQLFGHPNMTSLGVQRLRDILVTGLPSCRYFEICGGEDPDTSMPDRFHPTDAVAVLFEVIKEAIISVKRFSRELNTDHRKRNPDLYLVSWDLRRLPPSLYEDQKFSNAWKGLESLCLHRIDTLKTADLAIHLINSAPDLCELSISFGWYSSIRVIERFLTASRIRNLHGLTLEYLSCIHSKFLKILDACSETLQLLNLSNMNFDTRSDGSSQPPVWKDFLEALVDVSPHLQSLSLTSLGVLDIDNPKPWCHHPCYFSFSRSKNGFMKSPGYGIQIQLTWLDGPGKAHSVQYKGWQMRLVLEKLSSLIYCKTRS